MSNERINLLLEELEGELTYANDQLSLLTEEDEFDDSLQASIDYWTEEIFRIQNEIQSLLKSL